MFVKDVFVKDVFVEDVFVKDVFVKDVRVCARVKSYSQTLIYETLVGRDTGNHLDFSLLV